jgi:pimeloyl-ACP methyl ester carboxylesterase
MKKRTKIALGGAAAMGAAALLRRSGLREDLEWSEIVKPGHIIDIDAYGVHYLDNGEGPGLLLIHGFGGQTFQYRHQVPYFARTHRVIVPDLKGFGYSERDANAGLSHTDQVAMLRALLDRSGVTRVSVVGHSMGGAIAQRFAATYPERVDALVLAASMPADRPSRSPRVPGVLLRPVLPLLARAASSRLLETGFDDPSYLTEETREEYLRPARIKGSMDGLLQMMRDVRSDAPVDLSRLTMPVLLLYAAHDVVAPLSMAQQIRRSIPQARLTVVERAAHLLLEEQPDVCNRAIAEFLRESATPQHAASPAGPA